MQDKQIPQIKQYAKENVKEGIFADLYIDQTESGVIYVGFKNLERVSSEKKQEMKNLYYDSSKVKFYGAKYTEEELNLLHEQIKHDSTELQSQGVLIQRINTDVKTQQLRIGVKNLTEQTQNILSKRYNNDMFTIVEAESVEPASRTTRTRPLAGGLLMESETYEQNGQTYVGQCTLGFLAAGKFGDSNTYAVTAGHCRDGDWYQGDSLVRLLDKFGTVTYSKFSGSVDAQKIRLDNSSDLSEWIYGYGDPYWQAIYNVQSATAENVGDTVCYSRGKADANSCGTITDTNATISFSGGPTLYNMTQATTPGIQGDSGGPAYRGGTLLGLISAKDKTSTSPTWYSHISYIVSDLNITPITTQ